MKNFLSTKNTFTIAVLWGFVAVLIFLLIISFKNGFVQIPAMIALSVVIGLILWILLDTRYVIKNGLLLYRSGPFRGRIHIEQIKKIQYYSGLFVPVTIKPALDYNGFIISYSNHEDVFVSPKNSTIFIEELLKINPKIEVI